MEKDKLIKYALIAGGVILIYMWLKNNGYLNGLLGASTGTNTQPQLPATTTTPGITINTPGTVANQLPAQTTTPATTAPSTGAPATTTTPTPQLSDSDNKLYRAALYKADAGMTGDTKLNSWQWNFYRQQAAIAFTGSFIPQVHQAALDSYIDPTTPITAAEYHEILAKAGIDLSGLSAWGGGNTNLGGFMNALQARGGVN